MSINETLIELESRVQTQLAENQLDEVLEHVHQFSQHLTYDPRSTTRIFESKKLDFVCLEVGRITKELLPQRSAAEASALKKYDIVFLATELYVTGGHTRVIEDLIAIQPDKKCLVILTNIFRHQMAESVTERLSKLNINVINCPDSLSRLQQLQWTQVQIKEASPQRIYLFNHMEDSIAVAAVQPGVAEEVFFFHHCDHTFTLGLHIPNSKHLDFRAAGFENCKYNLGIKENFLLPLMVNGQQALNRTEFLVHDKLRTVTCGSSKKFESVYLHSFAEVIPQILKATGGTHLHIGVLSESYLEVIYDNLKLCKVDAALFIYSPHVDNVRSKLCEMDCDLYIDSFPIPGVKSLAEALAAGMPVITHHNYTSRLLSNKDYLSSDAPCWAQPSQLIEFIENLDKNLLETLAQKSLAWFEKHCSPTAVKNALNQLEESSRPQQTSRLDFYEIDSLQAFYDFKNMYKPSPDEQRVSVAPDKPRISKHSQHRILNGSQNIVFGQSVELIDMSIVRIRNGFELSGQWRALQTPEIARILAVHAVDSHGTILNQFDHRLLPELKSEYKHWYDVFKIRDDQLVGATGLALAVFDDPQETMVVQGGTCDWGNHRLLLPMKLNEEESGINN